MTLAEQGRRTEQVEWAVRWTKDTFLHRCGHVAPRASETAAREVIGLVHSGWGTADEIEVVSRTVVTYTTTWAAIPAAGKPAAHDETTGALF